MGARRTQEATDGDCWLPAARVLASGEERFVQVSLRIVLSVCRLIVAAVPWFWWVEASQAGCGCAAHPGGDSWLPAARVLASGGGAVRAGISPDSSVGLPVNPRSRAVVLVAGRWRRVRCESQRRGGTKALTKRHQPQPTHPSTRSLPARFRPLGVGGAILTQPQHGH